MKNILQFEEADQILKPYYAGLKKCLDKSIEESNRLCDIFSDESPASFKNRTKGSFMADRLKVHLEKEFSSDSNIRFVELRGALGIVVGEKLVIRFNKMDDKFKVSINKKTRSSNRYLNQMPIAGIESLTYIWGGFNPDKIWSKIVGYYLTCFNGNLNWHYDMGRNNLTQQLTIEMPTTKQNTKRVKPKKRNEGDSKEKTGTND